MQLETVRREKKKKRGATEKTAKIFRICISKRKNIIKIKNDEKPKDG